MPGHYGKATKKKAPKKQMSKGLAALAKKRPKVAAAIMKNKKKKYGKKTYHREDAVKNTIFLEDINRNPIIKRLGPNNVNEA